MRRIDVPAKGYKSLLYLTVDGERVIESQKSLAVQLRVSESKLSKSFLFESDRCQRFPVNVHKPLLAFLNSRLETICPGEEEVVESVLNLFEKRFYDLRGNLEEALVVANEGISARPPRSKGVAIDPDAEDEDDASPAEDLHNTGHLDRHSDNFHQPRKSLSPVMLTGAGIAVVAITLSTLSIWSPFKSDKQKVAPKPSKEAQREEAEAFFRQITGGVKHVVSLLPETSLANQQINTEIRGQIASKLNQLRIDKVKIFGSGETVVQDSDLARAFLSYAGSKTVQWLTVTDAGSIKRVRFWTYVGEGNVQGGRDTVFDYDTAKPDALKHVDGLVTQFLGNLIGYRVAELVEKGDHKAARELIQEAYRRDRGLASQRWFAQLEALMLAKAGKFSDALQMINRIDTTTVKSLGGFDDFWFGHDQLKARILFRLKRFEEAFDFITRTRMEGTPNEVHFGFQMAVVPPNTVIYELDFPKSYAGLVRVRSDCLVVIEWPFSKELQDVFHPPGKREGLKGPIIQLNMIGHQDLGPGLFYAGPEPQKLFKERVPVGPQLYDSSGLPMLLEYIRPLKKQLSSSQDGH